MKSILDIIGIRRIEVFHEILDEVKELNNDLEKKVDNLKKIILDKRNGSKFIIIERIQGGKREYDKGLGPD